MKNLLLASVITATSFAYGETVDLTKSQVYWEAHKVIAGGHKGTIPVVKADLKIVDKKLVSGTISLSVAQAQVLDLEGEWKQKFLDHIKSDDFFSVSKYPEATIKIEKIQSDKAYGLLTIKNTTHPIEFSYVEKNGEFTGDVVFDRTKYGIVYGSNNFFKNLGDKAIANDVKVIFKIVLK